MLCLRLEEVNPKGFGCVWLCTALTSQSVKCPACSCTSREAASQEYTEHKCDHVVVGHLIANFACFACSCTSREAAGRQVHGARAGDAQRRGRRPGVLLHAWQCLLQLHHCWYGACPKQYFEATGHFCKAAMCVYLALRVHMSRGSCHIVGSLAPCSIPIKLARPG